MKLFQISELDNKTFYNIMMAKDTWTDQIKRSFQDVVATQIYEPTCLYHGRRVINGV